MGITLDTGGGSDRPPSLKLPDEGNTATFAVIDSNPNIPMTEFGTGEPLLNKYGKQKMQTAVTVLVISADGATVGGQDDHRPAQPGDVATIWVSGYMKYDPDEDSKGGQHTSWGHAVDTVGGLEVGMVGNWKHLGELPSRGTFPRKNRKFALRTARPDEAEQTARCETLHNELHTVATDTAYDTVEEPF